MSSPTSNPKAIVASAALHALMIGIALWIAYDSGNSKKPQVFELVAGAGDNFGATEAPAIGVAGGGPALEIPLPPTLNPINPAATEASATPIEAAPTPPADPSPIEPAPPTPPTPPTKTKVVDAKDSGATKPVPDIPKMTKAVTRISDKRAANIKKKAEAEQKAAADRAAKEAALNAKRMTKEEFDKQNKGKGTNPSQRTTAGGGTGSTKRIDAEGIAGGVVGGSAKNKTGGAGGTALTRQDIELSDAYISLLIRKLKEAHQKPDGLSDLLQTIVEFRLTSSGSVVNVTIVSSSRNSEFDQSVLSAFRRISLPPPPPNLKTSDYKLTFKMKED